MVYYVLNDFFGFSGLLGESLIIHFKAFLQSFKQLIQTFFDLYDPFFRDMEVLAVLSLVEYLLKSTHHLIVGRELIGMVVGVDHEGRIILSQACATTKEWYAFAFGMDADPGGRFFTEQAHLMFFHNGRYAYRMRL